MPNYGEFRAWITIDSQILPEFDVKVEASSLEDPLTETVVTCWIPSEVGKVGCLYYYLGFSSDP
jgi:hypothetical protein